jgi:hypothetical protein
VNERCISATAIFFLLVSFSTAAPDELDEQFLDGLRHRRQFALAATFCERELAAPQLELARRAVLTGQLIRVRAAQALNAAPQSRQSYWDRSQAAADQFIRDHADHPRAILILVQAAQANLARGELDRMEAELAADKQGTLRMARASLRKVASQLEEVDRQLVQMISLRQRPTGKAREREGEELEVEELRALRWQVQHHLSRVLQNQALCYEPGSPDRVAALSQALEHLGTPLRELSADDPLAKQLRLAQAVCRRRLGEFVAAQKTLDELAGEATLDDLQPSWQAEQIRLRIESGQLNEALHELTKKRTKTGKSADLDFAQLEAYVALWRTADESSKATRWRDESVAMVERIELTHGSYWARRADLALIEAGQDRGGSSVAILIRTAADFYSKGQLEQATLVYDKAATAAGESEDATAAFESAYKAAAVQQRRKLHLDASRRFRTLSLANPNESRAPQTHLFAVVNTAEAVRSGETSLKVYIELLDEHRERWPSSRTSSQTGMWRGQLAEQQAAWPEAVSAYRGMAKRENADPTPAFTPALDSLGRCWLRLLAESPPDQLARQSKEATTFFDKMVFTGDGALRAEWDEPSLVAATLAAQLRIYYAPDEATTAERLLQQVVTDGTLESRFRATLLMGLAIGLQQERTEEGKQRLLQLEISDRSRSGLAFRILKEFAHRYESGSSADSLQPAALQQAALQQALAERLVASSELLSPEQQIEIQLIRARAVSVEDNEAAVVSLRDLSRQHPNHKVVLEAYAAMLLAGKDKSTLQQALDQWRRIASGCQPRSAQWYHAKYSVVLALYRLDQGAEAAKLIRYLQLTEDLESAGFAERFQKLLEQVVSRTR